MRRQNYKGSRGDGMFIDSYFRCCSAGDEQLVQKKAYGTTSLRIVKKILCIH